MLKLEMQRTSAMDVILTKLKLNLHEKNDSDFVPYQAESLLEKLEKNGEMDVKVFLNEIRCFYNKCESCLHVYRNAYKGVAPHLWMNSSEDLS